MQRISQFLWRSAVRVVVFHYFAVRFQVKQNGWRRHVLVARAHGADVGCGLCFFLFGEVGGSSAAFRGNYDPAVKQIIFSQFVVNHYGKLPCREEISLSGILAFPRNVAQ